MPRCDVCGNDYDKTFEVHMGDRVGVFDSFECAVHQMAPLCARCGVRVIGHGVESNGSIFCGANCAHLAGVAAAMDRVPAGD